MSETSESIGNDSHGSQSEKSKQTSFSGFDSVVRQDRQQRISTFGPNSIKIRKPNSILIDIYGVISPWNFVQHLKAFSQDNIGDYVRKYWNTKLVKNVVARLRDQIQIDRQAGVDIPEILPQTCTDDEIIESAVKCIQWLLENKQKTLCTQIDRLCTDLWSRSFENGTLKSVIYADVLDSFNYWRFEEFIKIYSYASGPVEGQRQFLRSTIYGDLNRYIANGLNSSGGYKFDSNKYKSLCAALREPKPEMLLYLTDDPRKARCAQTAGLSVLVVNRTGAQSGKYDPNETNGLIVVNNLSDIQFIADPNYPLQCC